MGRVALAGAVAALVTGLAGCGALVEGPPAETPAQLASAVTPDNPATAGIAKVALPTLSQDSFRRRAAAISVRVRNLSCDGVATGSGFAISAHTLVTNRHVVAAAEALEVETADGRTLRVTAARVGVLGDVAFVTVDDRLPVLADIKGSADEGNEIAAVGYPLGGPFTVARGVVVDSVDGTKFDIGGDVLRITAEVEPGNAGGPLLDRRGRVAGVVFAIEVATGFGLAIPMETVNSLVEKAGLEPVPPCGEE